jgi:hypothetical protein
VPRVQEYTFTPAAEDADYFADNVGGAGPFTQLATATPDGLAHQVSIKENSSQNQSGKTFTVVGTDADGKALTEVITGPTSGATVESSGYFKTVTSVTPSATLGANTVDVGYVDEFVSFTIPLDSRLGKAAEVDVTGTIDYTVQVTLDQVLKKDATVVWKETITDLTGKSADGIGQAPGGTSAFRFKANSYSTGATARIVTRYTSDAGPGVASAGGGGGGFFP